MLIMPPRNVPIHPSSLTLQISLALLFIPLFPSSLLSLSLYSSLRPCHSDSVSPVQSRFTSGTTPLIPPHHPDASSSPPFPTTRSSYRPSLRGVARPTLHVHTLSSFPHIPRTSPAVKRKPDKISTVTTSSPEYTLPTPACPSAPQIVARVHRDLASRRDRDTPELFSSNSELPGHPGSNPTTLRHNSLGKNTFFQLLNNCLFSLPFLLIDQSRFFFPYCDSWKKIFVRIFLSHDHHRNGASRPQKIKYVQENNLAFASRQNCRFRSNEQLRINVANNKKLFAHSTPSLSLLLSFSFQYSLIFLLLAPPNEAQANIIITSAYRQTGVSSAPIAPLCTPFRRRLYTHHSS